MGHFGIPTSTSTVICISNILFLIRLQKDPFSKQNEIKMFTSLLKICNDYLDDLLIIPTDKDTSCNINLKGYFAKLRIQERSALLGTIKKLEVDLEVWNSY